MDFSLFKRVINQVKDFVEVVDLDLYGEFTYNPQWADMIRYARSKGVFTVLNTNATLLDDNICSELIESGLDFISLSFDGASPYIYEKIRRGADYEKTLANIRNFLKKSSSVFSVIQMIHTTETADEIDAFRRMWKNSGVDVIRIKEYMTFHPDKDYLAPKEEKKDETKPAPCLFLWKNLVICRDGFVVPCCVDYDKIYVLGDANKQDIKEIWNGEPMRELRKKHARGEFQKVKLCSKCRPLTANPFYIILGSFVDDAMRRRIIPIIDGILRKGS